MQNITRNMQTICRIWHKICKIICRICKKYVKKYANPFWICRIVTSRYSAYFAYIYTPHFADVSLSVSSSPPDRRIGSSPWLRSRMPYSADYYRGAGPSDSRRAALMYDRAKLISKTLSLAYNLMICQAQAGPAGRTWKHGRAEQLPGRLNLMIATLELGANLIRLAPSGAGPVRLAVTVGRRNNLTTRNHKSISQWQIVRHILFDWEWLRHNDDPPKYYWEEVLA